LNSLWPKFEDPLVGLRLAASGAIKDEIIDFQEVALFVVAYLRMHYAQPFKARYQLEELPESKLAILDEIGRKRGSIVGGGHIDYDKVSELILREMRGGKIGNITLERPDDPFTVEMARVSMDEINPYA
jgi:ribosome biogenesis GTPase A